MFFVIPTSTAVLSLKEEAANSIPFSPDLIATFYFLFFELFLHSFSAAMCLIVAFAWTSIYRKAFPKLLFSIGIVLFASFAVEMICFFFLCFCRIDLLEVRIFFFASLIKALLGTVSFLVGKFHIAFKKNEGEALWKLFCFSHIASNGRNRFAKIILWTFEFDGGFWKIWLPWDYIRRLLFFSWIDHL